MTYEKPVIYADQAKEELYKLLVGKSRELILKPVDPEPDYKNIKLREEFDEDRYHPWGVFGHTNAETEICIRPREQIPYWLIVLGDKMGWEAVKNHEIEHVLNPDIRYEPTIDFLGGRRERDYIRSSKVRLY